MKRLKKIELEAIYSQIKQFAEYQRASLRPLVGHIEWLNKRVDELERELKKIRNPELWAKEDRIQEQYKKDQETIHAPKEYFPLAKRLKMMEPGSEEWVKTLRWNKLSEDQALELVKNYIDK